MADGDNREEEWESRQPAVLRPIGRALRSTYDADNHDSLGNDLTGLMLELARVDAPPTAPVASTAPPPAAPPPAPASWLRRLFGRSSA